MKFQIKTREIREAFSKNHTFNISDCENAVKHFRKIIDRVIDCINYQARLQSGFNIHFTAKTGKRKAISI